jgi:hypothetical protein
LVEHLHGKEGVDGSSPSEGFAKAPQTGAFSFRPTCACISALRCGKRYGKTDPRGGRLVGIVAQADIALRENEKKTGELVEAISEPSEGERS